MLPMTPNEKELLKAVKKHLSQSHVHSLEILLEARNKLVGYFKALEADKHAERGQYAENQ